MIPETKPVSGADPYSKIDGLNEAWKLLENQVKRYYVKKDDCPLTVERFGNQMRLCYNGRAISDCKAAEKIEAAQHLSNFYDAVLIVREEMAQGAKLASLSVRNWTLKLEALNAAGNEADPQARTAQSDYLEDR